ncbi:centrobin [Bombina bombina]|uniref:centrobin n=1 Tax=Bombina bombina TaxID=8345 RepID=UPI00235B0F2D|nr:centrobin [Bombina bombina]
MALPPAFSLHDSSLISGIEPLPLSPSPCQVTPYSSPPPFVLSPSSTSSFRRAASSGVTTQFYASLRCSREMDSEENITIVPSAEEHFAVQGPIMSDTEELANEMSRKLQEGVEVSGTKGVSSYISQMESVRSHLQNMLSLGKIMSAHSDPPEKREEEQSDSTSTLLSARPMQDRVPPFTLSGLEALFPHYSSLYSSVPSLPDLQLRDALERESTRRKHLEHHIQDLQNEILELQQRLTVTLTADRRKDTMIQQLDQTLAVVVGGWKQQEQQREEMMRNLREEQEKAELASERDQEMLFKIQKELLDTCEALSREKQVVTEKQQEIERLLEEGSSLSAQIQAEREKEDGAREEEHRKLEELKLQMENQQREWEERKRELQEEYESALEERRRELENERALTQKESQKSQQWQLTVSSLQEKVLSLEGDLQTAHRERDTLQMELNLEKARGESERVRMESEHKMRLEEAITERLSGVHEENSKHMCTVREQHRKQLLDLTSQHETEMSNQLSQFKSELQERERRHRDTIMAYELKLTQSEERAQEMSLALRRLENEQTEMLTQLQGVMQSHWSQALKVLTSKARGDAVSEGSHSFPPLTLPLQSVMQKNSEEKWATCQTESGYREDDRDKENQYNGNARQSKPITSQSDETVSPLIMEPTLNHGSNKSIKADYNNHDNSNQYIVDRNVNSQQFFGSSHLNDRISSQHIINQQMTGFGHLEDNRHNHEHIIGAGNQQINHFKEDSGPHNFRLSPFMDGSNHGITSTCIFKEISNQPLMGGSKSNSQDTFGNNRGSQIGINKHYNNGSSQSVMHESMNMNTICGGDFKEMSVQSLNRESSKTNRQSYNSNSQFGEPISQSASATRTFVGRDASNQSIHGRSHSVIDVSHNNSQQPMVRNTSLQNIFGSSNSKESNLPYMLDNERFKEFASQLISATHQNSAGFVDHRSSQSKAMGYGSKNHLDYLSSCRATDQDESFYPLQMEELSHSFSSHLGFFPLDPYPDDTSRESGILSQDTPEHPFLEDSLLKIENRSLDATSNMRGKGDSSLPNSVLQYYIRMLLDRTPGDPLNDDQEKDLSHLNPGPGSPPSSGVRDISHVLATHPDPNQIESHQYLPKGAFQQPIGSGQKNEVDSKLQTIPRKNTDPKVPDAVKKEVVSSQRHPPTQKVLKRVSTRGGRPGIWR